MAMRQSPHRVEKGDGIANRAHSLRSHLPALNRVSSMSARKMCLLKANHASASVGDMARQAVLRMLSAQLAIPKHKNRVRILASAAGTAIIGVVCKDDRSVVAMSVP